LLPLFATGAVDTGGKFATDMNDTSGTSEKFTAGVVDTGGAPCLVNISSKFFKKFEMILMLFSGAGGGGIIHEKSMKQKIL
jgi:hypothetical protein